MATWNLAPQNKKSAIEKMSFYKDGMIISIEQGFRWANFAVESDERPLSNEELKNEDGYELSCIDNDECWEMCDMTDGCWVEIERENDKVTEDEFVAFEAAWEEAGYSGVEDFGWSNDDTEYYFYGPLVLTNEDTGEEFTHNSLPDLVIATVDVPQTTPELTEWFPDTIDPVRVGPYQVSRNGTGGTWPGPGYADWDGKGWSVADIGFWRGTTK